MAVIWISSGSPSGSVEAEDVDRHESMVGRPDLGDARGGGRTVRRPVQDELIGSEVAGGALRPGDAPLIDAADRRRGADRIVPRIDGVAVAAESVGRSGSSVVGERQKVRVSRRIENPWQLPSLARLEAPGGITGIPIQSSGVLPLMTLLTISAGNGELGKKPVWASPPPPKSAELPVIVQLVSLVPEDSSAKMPPP